MTYFKYFASILLLSFVFSGPKLHAQTSPDSAIQEIAHFLDSMEEEDGLSGVVLVAKDGVPVLERSFGMAHIGYQIPNSPQTLFNFASMGKMFTGVSILQLKEKGLLNLQDRVGEHLPNYPNVAVRDSVTIHQLLTHTSGMPDFMTDEYLQASKHNYRHLNDYALHYQNENLDSKPGGKFVYCNSDYIVLGLIIESISGKSYFEYVEDHIFTPAGMQTAAYLEMDHASGPVALGYTPSTEYPDKLMSNIYLNAVRGAPFGGGYARARDFLHFANALQENRLLSATSKELLTREKGVNGSYAYGFVDLSIQGHRILGHSGGHWGIACELSIYEDLGYEIVVMTNRDATDGFFDVRYAIQKALIGDSKSISSYFFTKELLKEFAGNGYYSALEMMENSDVQPRGGMMNQQGFLLLSQNNHSRAIELFQLYTLAHPESADAFDCLGEAHLEAGNTDKARKFFQKALELDSTDSYARKKLTNMEKED